MATPIDQLFHLCPVRLAIGSVILPGNWGRVIRRSGWGHTRALPEIALELVRQAKSPTLPSRLDCAFAFLTISEARLFWAEQRGRSPFDVLYRVSLADLAAPTFVTDWSRVTPNGGVSSAWADDYWSEPPGIEGHSPTPIGSVVQMPALRRKVLTMSPLVVEECLDLS